jgi:hypothetical protein
MLLILKNLPYASSSLFTSRRRRILLLFLPKNVVVVIGILLSGTPTRLGWFEGNTAVQQKQKELRVSVRTGKLHVLPSIESDLLCRMDTTTGPTTV